MPLLRTGGHTFFHDTLLALKHIRKTNSPNKIQAMHFQPQLHWVSSPSEILTELTNSKENGNVIGITASSLSPVMIMTAVEAIIDAEHGTIIQLKEQDLLGMKIPHSKIPLSDIVKVHPLRTKYNDPRHRELRNLIKM